MPIQETKYGDLAVSEAAPFVALCEIQRPPNNFFDVELIKSIAEAFENLSEDPACRAIVLAAEGKHFCAGANFSNREERGERIDMSQEQGNPLYFEAVRTFDCKKPIVAAVQGAAVGGGFGLAMMPDFRVACAEARFTANFVKLGFTPGFGLTHTLPRLIGEQAASMIFLTGRRLTGEQAKEIGIVDQLVSLEEVRPAAIALAAEIAENAPLAVMAVRAAVRGDIAQKVKEATDREHADQHRLQKTNDHKEGVKAVAERRPGNFTGT